MSEMLEKARKYEEEQGKQIKAEDRPAFHVSPYGVHNLNCKQRLYGRRRICT